MTRTATNIANQIVNARDSSSLISISSNFENSTNVRSFFEFDFTSRSYETSQKTSSVFVISKKNSKTSSFEFTRANSILDFIENSKASSIAQTSTQKATNSAKSIFILQFVFHQKSTFSDQSAKITLNSNSTFSNQVSSKSITSESDKQTVWTSANYEISRNIFAVELSSAFNMSQEFIETQRRELMIMMQEFWIQRSSFSAFSAASAIIQTSDQKSERWVTADLEFFDSTYNEKILATIESMQYAEKNIFFKNIHLFIDRVKNFAMIKDYDAVKNNLYTCLRSMTMTWYTIEFFEKIKKLIKTKNNLNVWKRYLIKRFRERSTMTMITITITREKYILNDARRCRESREYAEIIIRAIKFAKLKSKTHLVMLIYNDLNVELQRNIFMLDLIINIQNFLQSFDDKKKIWWTLTRRNKFIYEEKKSYVNYTSKSNATYQNQFSIYYQFKFDQYNSQYSKQRNFEFSQRDQFSYQYDVNQFYQSQSQTFTNAKQLKTSKSRLQIIDSSQQNEFASFSKSYSSRFDQENNREEYDRRDQLKRIWNQRNSWNNRNRDNYNRDKAQEAYVDAIKKNQDNMKHSRNNQNHYQKSKFILNEFDKENENHRHVENQYNEEYEYFLNEKKYHIDTELITQKIFKIHKCRKCKRDFAFSNKLHRHVRECRQKSNKDILSIETFHIDETHVTGIIISSTKFDFTKDLIFRF